MDSTPLPLDEERLTAYALNEMEPAERDQIAAHLLNDPTARQFVDDVRATADVLTRELKNERFEDVARAAAVLPAAAPVPQALPKRRSNFALFAASMAAAVIVGVFGVMYFGRSFDAAKSVAVNSPAPAIGNEGPGALVTVTKLPPPQSENAAIPKVAPSTGPVAIMEDGGKTQAQKRQDPPLRYSEKATLDTIYDAPATVTVGGTAPINGVLNEKKKDEDWVVHRVDSAMEAAKKASDQRRANPSTPAAQPDPFVVVLDKVKERKAKAAVEDGVVMRGTSNRDSIDIPVGSGKLDRNHGKREFDFAGIKVPTTEAPPKPPAVDSINGFQYPIDGKTSIKNGKVLNSSDDFETVHRVEGPDLSKYQKKLMQVAPDTAPSIPDKKLKTDEAYLRLYGGGIDKIAPEKARIPPMPEDPLLKKKLGDREMGYAYIHPNPNPVQPGGETYPALVENGFESVRTAPLSTFSADVDTASYSNIRRFIGQNQLPPPDAVRIEELVNYFRYNYETGKGEDPFTASIESAACPWNAAHRLVRVAVRAHDLAANKRPNSNLVFLIDVSGSMDAPNRLPLVKEGMKSLVRRLGETDRVAIVTYAGESAVSLPSTNCSQKEQIIGVIDSLHAQGSTNGGSGIQTAYATAKANFIKEGVNRVILATDGDFNVGVVSPDALVALIEAESKSGVFLTALGYGMGNYKDATLQRLADKGHGNYAYIDSAEESRKVLLEQMNATLVSVAKDVKLQVEFNPAQSTEYRLIGYEKRVMPAREFNDDTKDAGVIGAGHTVTAFYEIATTGAAITADPNLKYQPKTEPVAVKPANASTELLTLSIRYKTPEANASKRLDIPFTDKGESFEKASPDFKFAAGVALFGQVLRQSRHTAGATIRQAIELADDARGTDEGGYRREFIQLARRAAELRGEQ